MGLTHTYDLIILIISLFLHLIEESLVFVKQV